MSVHPASNPEQDPYFDELEAQVAVANDPYDLQRFVDAQNMVWEEVLWELAGGEKCTHWIWFVFPQEAHLGRSETAKYYGIKSDEEAQAYLEHPVLSRRLRLAAQLVRCHRNAGRELEDMFPAIDALKFRTCMALFGRVSGEKFFLELA